MGNRLKYTGMVVRDFRTAVAALRKHAHAIYRKSFGCKNEKFHWKNFDIFLTFAQNIDCGYTLEPPRRGGSNEYPQSILEQK